MGDEIFSVYLTPADYSKLAYAKLDLPASPWKLLDALDKVRLSEGDSLYLEITEYRDFEVLHSSLVCSATNLLELNDLAERLSRLNEVQRIAFEGLVRVDFQKQESITLKRLRDLAESVDCCHVVESVVSDGQLLEHINEHPEIMVTWFQPDEKKDGGQYITTTGRLKRFDESACMLLLKDGSNIPISHIIGLESAYFEGLF